MDGWMVQAFGADQPENTELYFILLNFSLRLLFLDKTVFNNISLEYQYR